MFFMNGEQSLKIQSCNQFGLLESGLLTSAKLVKDFETPVVEG